MIIESSTAISKLVDVPSCPRRRLVRLDKADFQSKGVLVRHIGEVLTSQFVENGGSKVRSVPAWRGIGLRFFALPLQIPTHREEFKIVNVIRHVVWPMRFGVHEPSPPCINHRGVKVRGAIAKVTRINSPVISLRQEIEQTATFNECGALIWPAWPRVNLYKRAKDRI